MQLGCMVFMALNFSTFVLAMVPATDTFASLKSSGSADPSASTYSFEPVDAAQKIPARMIVRKAKEGEKFTYEAFQIKGLSKANEVVNRNRLEQSSKALQKILESGILKDTLTTVDWKFGLANGFFSDGTESEKTLGFHSTFKSKLRDGEQNPCLTSEGYELAKNQEGEQYVKGIEVDVNFTPRAIKALDTLNNKMMVEKLNDIFFQKLHMAEGKVQLTQIAILGDIKVWTKDGKLLYQKDFVNDATRFDQPHITIGAQRIKEDEAEFHAHDKKLLDECKDLDKKFLSQDPDLMESVMNYVIDNGSSDKQEHKKKENDVFCFACLRCLLPARPLKNE